MVHKIIRKALHKDNATSKTLPVFIAVVIIALIAGTIYFSNPNVLRQNTGQTPKTQSQISTQKFQELLKNKPETLTKLDATDMSESEIAANIEKFTNLQEAYLPRNSMSAIPDSIFTLTKLTTLWMPNNKIKAVPAQISQLKKLKVINLISNQLQTLPPEVGQLTELEELYLSSNEIFFLPQEISGLKNLKVLTLEGNKLSDREIAKIKGYLPNVTISFGVKPISVTPPATKTSLPPTSKQ